MLTFAQPVGNAYLCQDHQGRAARAEQAPHIAGFCKLLDRAGCSDRESHHRLLLTHTWRCMRSRRYAIPLLHLRNRAALHTHPQAYVGTRTCSQPTQEYPMQEAPQAQRDFHTSQHHIQQAHGYLKENVTADIQQSLYTPSQSDLMCICVRIAECARPWRCTCRHHSMQPALSLANHIACSLASRHHRHTGITQQHVCTADAGHALVTSDRRPVTAPGWWTQTALPPANRR
jgi:hypothetical protein